VFPNKFKLSEVADALPLFFQAFVASPSLEVPALNQN
jgi:hypothetical protein